MAVPFAVAASVLAQILDDVELTLLSIVAGTEYATSVQEVARGRLTPFETNRFPMVSIVPANDQPEVAPQILRRELRLLLLLWIDGDPATAEGTLMDFIADVQRAMQVDDSRGGMAEATLEGPLDFIYDAHNERFRGAQLAYAIPYRTARTDARQVYGP